MNTFQLAEDFRALFAALVTAGTTGLVGRFTFTRQESADYQSPALVFAVDATPFSSDGKTGVFELTVTAESNPADTTEAAHLATVAAVQAQLLGTGQAALLAALNALTRWTCKGWSAAADADGVASSRFETPCKIVGTIIQL